MASRPGSSALIEYHNYRYYVEDAPVISDLEFDRLVQRLRGLEKQHPKLVTPDSPTQRVGARLLAGFLPVRHRTPMLSLDNTYAEADVRAFDRRVRRWLAPDRPQYVVEEKIDGVSVSLTYERGRLVLAATRGDGQTGDDVTQTSAPSATFRCGCGTPTRRRSGSRSAARPTKPSPSWPASTGCKPSAARHRSPTRATPPPGA